MNEEKEWAVVKVPCHGGIICLGLDYDSDWPKSLQIESNLTYEESVKRCKELSEQMNLPRYCDEYDVDWHQIHYDEN
jgi:hypothetical protein